MSNGNDKVTSIDVYKFDFTGERTAKQANAVKTRLIVSFIKSDEFYTTEFGEDITRMEVVYRLQELAELIRKGV